MTVRLKEPLTSATTFKKPPTLIFQCPASCGSNYWKVRLYAQDSALAAIFSGGNPFLTAARNLPAVDGKSSGT
jgi:hypothetical protein